MNRYYDCYIKHLIAYFYILNGGDTMGIIIDNHTITPRVGGLFTVRNNRRAVVYTVDIYQPYCSCPDFKYNGRTRTGRKRICKHIRICRNIKDSKV